MFNFNFANMTAWYDSQLDNENVMVNDKKMVAFFIIPALKYESAKKQKTGKKSKFIKQFINIDKIRRINSQLINNKQFYPNGLYYVKQNDSNVFFVLPRLKTNIVGESIFLADHYSFPYVKSKDRIDIHLTTYTPFESDITMGTINHLPRCPIHNNVLLPIQGYETQIFNAMGGLNHDVLDICRAYKTYEAFTLPIMMHAGAKYKLSITSSKSKSKIKSVSLRLEERLIQLKVKRVSAFGFFENNVWNVMVDLVRPESSTLANEFAFELNKPTFNLFEKKLLSLL